MNPKLQNPSRPWHSLSADEALEQLGSSRQGLSQSEAERRLDEYGPNELRKAEQTSPGSILLEQFKNVLIIILLIGAGLSAYLGHEVEAIAIAVIVLFAVILGFVQEYRAERAIEALREMAAPTTVVFRDGDDTEVSAKELVPGDVVVLHAGDRVPADARLIQSANLQVEEAALTGESVPVEKSLEALSGTDLALGDRRNIVFAGTAVTYGRGQAVVIGTGMQTEFGKIAHMLEDVETGQTPLQENLDRVGKVLAWAALVVVLVIVGLGVMRGQDILEMLVFGIALAVAVVPEALPAVVTVSLAIGVQRMVKRNALVRRLPAVETLGSTSVICSDKTGTLTKDEMTARKIFAQGQIFEISGTGYEPHGEFIADGQTVEPPEFVRELLRAAALSSDAHVERNEERGTWEVQGDPTEGALIIAASKAGLPKEDLDAQFPRTNEIPFTSETKRMTTLHQEADRQTAYTKGAPETILGSCISYRSEQGEEPLGEEQRAAIVQTIQELASEGLRVLGLAMRTDASLENAEQEMTFLGLVGMIDPPRPEAKAALEKCEAAGIKVIMITGDHPLTAQAVAKELGLFRDGKAVTGPDVEAMSDEQLEQEVEGIDVFSRVSPAHKLRTVQALQQRGHVVAMTGDGVNDAPALKKADIGIAMGITGTDVSKEAAAMMLTDDNFASIVAAVEEGRGIFDNIKKYLMYLLSSNIGEIGLMAGASLFGLPLPLSAVQILYVNLATDGLPALALSVDPPEEDLMEHPPRDPNRGIFTRPVVALMLIGGIWSTLINIGLFYWAYTHHDDVTIAMTLTFVCLVLIQFFKAYNFRSDRRTVFHRPFANKWLNLAIFWELMLLVAVVYVPWLQKPFGTHNLTLNEWLVVGGLALSVCPVLELGKWMERRGWFGKME